MNKFIVILGILLLANNVLATTTEEKIEKIKDIINDKGTIDNYDSRLWKTNNLNELMCDNPDLRPKDSGEWAGSLAWSEYCSYCGAFTYYHQTDGKGNRKCCRCNNEWKSKNAGNYYGAHSSEPMFMSSSSIMQ